MAAVEAADCSTGCRAEKPPSCTVTPAIALLATLHVKQFGVPRRLDHGAERAEVSRPELRLEEKEAAAAEPAPIIHTPVSG